MIAAYLLCAVVVLVLLVRFAFWVYDAITNGFYEQAPDIEELNWEYPVYVSYVEDADGNRYDEIAWYFPNEDDVQIDYVKRWWGGV